MSRGENVHPCGEGAGSHGENVRLRDGAGGPRGTDSAKFPPIMIRKDYIPREESSLLTWAENLNAKASETPNQTAMGWTAAKASEVTTAAANLTSAVMEKETARSTYLSAVAAADTQIEDALDTIRPLVASGKENANYTKAVGELLQVIGAEVEFNPQTYKADLRDVTPVGNSTLRVKFAKALGELDAARLFTRKAGQTAWTLAATMIRSPYLHHMTLTTPGVPEAIEVRICGVVGNDDIGDFSDIATVTLT